MTDEPLTISLAELRQAVDVLLRRVEAAAGGDVVALGAEYFWAVPPDEQYDVATPPGELTIGQLSESWQHLRDLVAEPDRAVGYHLVWLADVLRAIGRDRPA
ncbi:hypothetical protein ACWGB8_37315 [Kitasatospora sp. NPDC054939]